MPDSRDSKIRKITQMIEEVLNTPIPGTPNISGVKKTAAGYQGRVMYVALPGSSRKSQNALSHRAQQVFGHVKRNGRASAKALMVALEVNRNVIAGAVHELKQAGILASEPLMAGASQSAAEYHPRRTARKKTRK